MKTTSRLLSRRGFHRAAAGIACLIAAAGAVTVPAAQAAAASAPRQSEGLKVLPMPIRTDGPKQLDPILVSTVYENMATSQIYETLLENKYTDPTKLEPRLLTDMPEVSEDGLTYRFTLKPGVKFYDPGAQPVFAGGERTRELTADDVIYSIKRLAHPEYLHKSWWLVEGRIKGFDEYDRVQNERVKAGQAFDFDAPVEGLRKIDSRTFEIELTEPFPVFLYRLAMSPLSIVPREAVEKHGKDFAFKAVGTGPFVLNQFTPKKSLTLDRNPEYHEVLYPERREWSRDDLRRRMHLDAGKRVPFVDRIEFTMFVEDQPMWLQFQSGNLGYTEVTEQYWEQAFDARTKEIKPELAANGMQWAANPLMDFIFRAFNMEDELLGGYTPDKRALRQAIHLAVDHQEFNQLFYNGLATVYDGPIPPQLDGHPEGGRVEGSLQGPNLELARQKLAEAGYPNGQGLPPIRFYTSRGGLNESMADLLRRQLRKVNIEIEPVFVDFSTLMENVDNRKAPFFGFAWSSDYPDAENNLSLYYGPNESPGNNHSNYKNPEYDALYEKAITMPVGDERTRVYEQLRDMVIRDTPFVGSLARVRYYLAHPWLENWRPTELYYGWFKYLDVADTRAGAR